MSAIPRLSFQVSARSGHARRGELTLRHGKVQTPVFMPVGTQGTVKALSPDDLEHKLDAEIILGNTYHLYLRPGHERLRRLGGLHSLMKWPRNLLTDSGGFQVFSLGAGSTQGPSLLEKITEQAAFFRSHIDGAKHELSPEKSIEIQEAIGSDIMMVLDECPPPGESREYQERSMARTTRWAARCLQARTEAGGAMFAIIQGGMLLDLRERHVRDLARMNFDGYAIGGLAVGESKEDFLKTLRFTAPLMPEDKPRYLMGVGTPEDLVEGVRAGVDMFDCVMPTRNARNGSLFVDTGKIQIKNARFAEDLKPIEEGCECYTCKRFSRAYLRHLFIAEELLFHRLTTLHNLHYYLQLMKKMRAAIERDELEKFASEFYAKRSVTSAEQ